MIGGFTLTGLELHDRPWPAWARSRRTRTDESASSGMTRIVSETASSFARRLARGRRSGQPRRAALHALRHGGGRAGIGSRAGDTRHPDWYRNLMAEPWTRFVAVDDAYEEYARRTTRRIPVTVLERAAE
jgi:hypothetical protein